MLKIKELHKDGTKVDLKELEKFGFERVTCQNKFESYDRTKFIDRGTFGRATFQRIIIKQDKIVRFYTMSRKQTFNKKWANDLIKADLVEKVEE